MAKITYDDKSYLNLNGNIPNVNKVTDNDMNEIKNVVNANYDAMMDELYYKTGDTFTIGSSYSGYYTGGIVSSGRKALVWTITLPKRLTNITSITIDSLNLTIRHSSGGYIYNDTPLASIDGNLNIYINTDNTITIVNERTTEVTAVTNNTPIGVAMYGTFTLN